MVVKDKSGSQLDFFQAKNGKVYGKFNEEISFELSYLEALKLPKHEDIIKDINAFRFAYGKVDWMM